MRSAIKSVKKPDRIHHHNSHITNNNTNTTTQSTVINMKPNDKHKDTDMIAKTIQFISQSLPNDEPINNNISMTEKSIKNIPTKSQHNNDDQENKNPQIPSLNLNTVNNISKDTHDNINASHNNNNIDNNNNDTDNMLPVIPVIKKTSRRRSMVDVMKSLDTMLSNLPATVTDTLSSARDSHNNSDSNSHSNSREIKDSISLSSSSSTFNPNEVKIDSSLQQVDTTDTTTSNVRRSKRLSLIATSTSSNRRRSCLPGSQPYHRLL